MESQRVVKNVPGKVYASSFPSTLTFQLFPNSESSQPIFKNYTSYFTSYSGV